MIADFGSRISDLQSKSWSMDQGFQSEIVKVRAMMESDIPDLVKIDAVSNQPAWTESMFRKELDLPFSVSAVAVQEDRPIGFGIVWIVSFQAQLLELAVLSDQRKKGVGSAILNYLVHAARERGCKKMELEYRENNTAAKSLYQKMGFKITGERKKFYENADTAVLMECEL
jgi:ribosomal-protein-alanine N-acetyltransferase